MAIDRPWEAVTRPAQESRVSAENRFVPACANYVDKWPTHFLSLSLVNLLLTVLSIRRIGRGSVLVRAGGSSDGPEAAYEDSEAGCCAMCCTLR
jgi:hypothetical protein